MQQLEMKAFVFLFLILFEQLTGKHDFKISYFETGISPSLEYKVNSKNQKKVRPTSDLKQDTKYPIYLKISELRAGGCDLQKSCYVTDVNKEGLFIYDSKDIISKDDNATIIVSGTARFKRVIEDGIKPEWFGALGDGVSDDYASIQAAFSCHFNKITLKNNAVYKINKNISLDLTSRIVEGNGATLNFSAINAGNALSIRGKMSPSFAAAGKSKISNLVLIGNDKNGLVTGLFLDETNETGAISNCVFENLAITLFGTGVKFGNRVYINTFSGCNIYSNGVGVHIIDGSIDSGANNRFTNCNISGCTLGIRINRDSGTIFSNVSIGENEKHVSVLAGNGYFNNCHFEGANYKAPMIEILSGNGSGIILKSCAIVTNLVRVKPDYYFFIEPSSNQFRIIEVEDCQISNPDIGVNIALCGGAKSAGTKFIISKTRSYWNHCLPLVTHIANNLLVDGGFEDTLLNSDPLFIVSDTEVLSNKFNGTNINLSSYSSIFYSGSRSLKISKAGPINTKAGAVLAIPCKGNTLYRGKYQYRQLGMAKGAVNIGIGAGNMILSKDTYLMKQYVDLYYSKHNPTKKWEEGRFNDFMFKTTASDRYVFINIDLTSFGAGDFLLDNVELYEY